MEKMVRGIGILALLAIAISIGSAVIFRAPSQDLPRGFRSPILALELVETKEEVEQIVGKQDDARREKARTSLNIDFLFIATYWLLFMLLSGLLANRLSNRLVWLAALAGVCATAAAAFDVLENLRIFQVLDVSPDMTSQRMVDNIRTASLWKWALIFIAMAILSLAFFRRKDMILLLIGLVYLLAAVMGLVGIGPWYRLAIECSAGPMGLGLIATAFLFTFWPRKFLQGF